MTHCRKVLEIELCNVKSETRKMRKLFYSEKI